MRYSLRQLEVFLATAREENVSRAAESLAMSQSAASGSLKELEQQFGIQLFDRVGKRLQLSDLGRQLRPQAESLLDQARAFEEALEGDSTVGHLEVGATLTIGNYRAVNMLADFRARHPGASVGLRVANTESIAAAVADFTLDVGLIEGEFHHPDLDIQHWRGDELVAFAAPGHPLTGRRTLNDADLIALPWIVRETGSGTRQAFDRALQAKQVARAVEVALQAEQAHDGSGEVEPSLACVCVCAWFC